MSESIDQNYQGRMTYNDVRNILYYYYKVKNGIDFSFASVGSRANSLKGCDDEDKKEVSSAIKKEVTNILTLYFLASGYKLLDLTFSDDYINYICQKSLDVKLGSSTLAEQRVELAYNIIGDFFLQFNPISDQNYMTR